VASFARRFCFFSCSFEGSCLSVFFCGGCRLRWRRAGLETISEKGGGGREEGRRRRRKGRKGEEGQSPVLNIFQINDVTHVFGWISFSVSHLRSWISIKVKKEGGETKRNSGGRRKRRSAKKGNFFPLPASPSFVLSLLSFLSFAFSSLSLSLSLSHLPFFHLSFPFSFFLFLFCSLFFFPFYSSKSGGNFIKEHFQAIRIKELTQWVVILRRSFQFHNH